MIRRILLWLVSSECDTRTEIEATRPCGRGSITCSRPFICLSCYPSERA